MSIPAVESLLVSRKFVKVPVHDGSRTIDNSLEADRRFETRRPAVQLAGLQTSLPVMAHNCKTCIKARYKNLLLPNSTSFLRNNFAGIPQQLRRLQAISAPALINFQSSNHRSSAMALAALLSRHWDPAFVMQADCECDPCACNPPAQPQAPAAFAPVDVRETEESYDFVMDVPGLNKDQVKVKLEQQGRVLVLSGEREQQKKLPVYKYHR